MDQFCAACTSLPITQTSIAVREEKAKLLQLDKQSKNSVVESPRSTPPVRAGDNSDAVTREADLKGSSTGSSVVTLRSHEERANALQSNNQGSEINSLQAEMYYTSLLFCCLFFPFCFSLRSSLFSVHTIKNKSNRVATSTFKLISNSPSFEDAECVTLEQR